MIRLNQQLTVRGGPYAGQKGSVLEIDRAQVIVWLMLQDKSVERFGVFEVSGD
jgi:hypothetical protein